MFMTATRPISVHTCTIRVFMHVGPQSSQGAGIITDIKHMKSSAVTTRCSVIS